MRRDDTRQFWAQPMEFFPMLTDEHCAFVARQPVFFVATAAEGARINLSRKGADSFCVLDAAAVAYLDVGGSGNETNAHLTADGRITIMFCAFGQPALIFCIYGKGRAVLLQDEGGRISMRSSRRYRGRGKSS
jgi:hypothetical protein